jgi:hypothetical protein
VSAPFTFEKHALQDWGRPSAFLLKKKKKEKRKNSEVMHHDYTLRVLVPRGHEVWAATTVWRAPGHSSSMKHYVCNVSRVRTQSEVEIVRQIMDLMA